MAAGIRPFNSEDIITESNVIRSFRLSGREEAMFRRAVDTYRSGIAEGDTISSRTYKIAKFALYSAKERVLERLGLKVSDWKQGIRLLSDKMGGNEEELAQVLIGICASRSIFHGDPMPEHVGGIGFNAWSRKNIGALTLDTFHIQRKVDQQARFSEINAVEWDGHGFSSDVSRLIAGYLE